MSNVNNQQTLIIHGCGGHARSVADVALFNGVNELLFVDAMAREHETLFGFPVVKSAASPLHASSIVALGDNQLRATLFTALQKNNVKLPPLIARDAYVSSQLKNIADGVFVGHGVHLGPNVSIAENTILNTHCLIEHDVIVGKHCHISINATVAGKCRIGDFVMLGANATLIDNVSLCDNVIIGAGALVIASITEPGTYVGVPARKV